MNEMGYLTPMMRNAKNCINLFRVEKNDEISLDHTDGKWCRNCKQEKAHRVLNKHLIIMYNKKRHSAR